MKWNLYKSFHAFSIQLGDNLRFMNKLEFNQKRPLISSHPNFHVLRWIWVWLPGATCRTGQLRVLERLARNMNVPTHQLSARWCYPPECVDSQIMVIFLICSSSSAMPFYHSPYLFLNCSTTNDQVMDSKQSFSLWECTSSIKDLIWTASASVKLWKLLMVSFSTKKKNRTWCHNSVILTEICLNVCSN